MITKYVNTPVNQTVNVRKEPNTDAVILHRLERGTPVSVEPFNPEWDRIHAPCSGFIMKKFLSRVSPDAFDDRLLVDGYANTVSGHLNLREGPGTEYDVVASIPHLDRLQYIPVSSNWLPVKYKGIWGYCSSKYVGAGVLKG
ncbi:SH3 domain-containing protein [Beduinella massiliensis]|uniref:SH3 domain-containing protein n=1 Tax=Beduinella massiliensis TaxID=1852363 RepID=UPI000C83EA2A